MLSEHRLSRSAEANVESYFRSWWYNHSPAVVKEMVPLEWPLYKHQPVAIKYQCS